MPPETPVDEHVLPTYRRAEPVFVAGRGATLVDSEGREYLDLLGGIAVNALGHAHPRLVEALRDQIGRVAHVSNLYRHPYTEEVAARLARLCGLAAVFFSNSGAEANECALKLARRAQARRGAAERTHFVALEGGFHGRTAGSLSLTASPTYREPFGPLLDCRFVAPEDLGALEAALATRPAALFLEPIQGEGGLRTLSPTYLRAARERCDATGTLLVCDEVQCGSGRTGRFLAAQHAGVVPDVVTLAKPLAGGLPIGATVVAAELVDALAPGEHGSTFGGGPLVLRAALVFLEELEQGGLLEAVRRRGDELGAGLDALVARHAGVERRVGRGLIQGLVVPGRHRALQQGLFERGVLAATAGADVVRFLPPYVITSSELERALAQIDETLGQVLEPVPAP